MTSRIRRGVTAVALCALVFAGACGDDDSDDQPEDSPSTTAPGETDSSSTDTSNDDDQPHEFLDPSDPDYPQIPASTVDYPTSG